MEAAEVAVVAVAEATVTAAASRTAAMAAEEEVHHVLHPAMEDAHVLLQETEDVRVKNIAANRKLNFGLLLFS